MIELYFSIILRITIWYMISIYLESIKFLISAWIKLARNAFEDMAIFNGYPVICKWEGMMPSKCKKCTYAHVCGNVLQNFMIFRERIS